MPEISACCKTRTIKIPISTPIGLDNLSARLGVCIKANRNNRGSIYFGGSDVGIPGNGFELLPGDTVFLPIENSAIIYMIAELADDTASYFVV